MNAIALEGVTRSFCGRRVLRGVSAAAAAGRVVGLLGRNGEGKTTLMRILLDILEADAGTVEVLGRRPDGSGELRRRVGYVPERPSFHDFMTLGEALDLRRRLFPSWNREKAASLAAHLGLELSARVSAASKGTLGKLAWVCAAAHEPDLFLLDEPTSGLDALVRDDLLSNLISELHGSGKTFLIANHRMEELSGLLDEVWLLHGGAVAVHDAEALRTQARRVTGRPKAGGEAAPSGALRLPGVGALAEYAVFGKEDEARLLADGLLEGAESRPMPLSETLKVLLMSSGGAL
ncbi:MAG: ABC transporter ATP-binding protein [Elusimicrobia bacterium]|nr:ABC transporter ATP-binding protein [Elusimicrobiota bacterium]